MMFRKILLPLVLILCLAVPCAVLAEEEDWGDTVVEFDLDGGGAHGGFLRMYSAYGPVEETESYGFCMELEDASVSTIGEMMNYFDIDRVEPVREGDVFEGWMVYEAVVTEDEEGFETYRYVKYLVPEGEDGLYTTEELMDMPLPSFYAVYVAKWAGVAQEEYFAQQPDEDVNMLPGVTLSAGSGVLFCANGDEAYEVCVGVGIAVPGATVKDVLEMEILTGMSEEGAELTGWTVYEMEDYETTSMPVEEEGALCIRLEDDWYMLLRAYTVLHEHISTEKMNEIVCGEKELLIVANYR